MKSKELKSGIDEIRSFGGPIELRQEGDGMPIIRGYAAKYGVLSEFMLGWRERIEPGAFDDRLKDDVRALINHDGIPLARTRSSTLSLSVDSDGLIYEFTPPDTEEARTLVAGIERGDIDQSSFAFRTTRDKWEFIEDEEQGMIRSIKGFTRLRDVSVVTFPAYPDTEAFVKRSIDREVAEAFEDYQRNQEGHYKDQATVMRELARVICE